MLKTGEYFSSQSLPHISLDCSFCLVQLETLEHLFLSCAFAKEVWDSPTLLFCKLPGVPNFVPSLQTLIGLDFVKHFLMATQKLAVYFLKLVLYAIWHYKKMKHFEKLACTAQSAISLVEFSFKQTWSRKFEVWQQELKLSKFRKHWCIGEAFCRADCLDHLVFTFC